MENQNIYVVLLNGGLDGLITNIITVTILFINFSRGYELMEYTNQYLVRQILDYFD